jgi:hypothetical protein
MENLVPREIIQAAKDALKPAEQTVPIVPEVESQNLPATVTPNLPAMDIRPPLPASYQKFAGIPEQLRENAEVNIFQVKRLNLAAALESLEHAADAYEGFPTPDGGFAVAGLSEVVLKLTKDLERTQDPMILLNQIKNGVLNNFVQQIIVAIASELKNLRRETTGLIPDDKQNAYSDSIKNTLSRTTTAFTESLEEVEDQLKKVLGIKVKKEKS